jgi:hypothetical protein
MKRILTTTLILFWLASTVAFAVHLYYYYEKQENRAVAGISREQSDHKILQNVEKLIQINTEIRDTYQAALAKELILRQQLIDDNFRVLMRIENKLDTLVGK